jgi:hypothetical protein
VAARHWIRARWLYLLLFGFLSFVTWSAQEMLLPAFTLLATACGLTIGVLMTISPIQAILARRSGNSPWWWDALFWACVVGVTLMGAVLHEPALMVVGLLASLVLVVVMTLGIWFVEVRYAVRVYSKARGVVFVGTGDAL